MPHSDTAGDELYVFGSNKNLSLGIGDEDDRQFPERIHLNRPDALLRRFYAQHCDANDFDTPDEDIHLEDIPVLVKNRPLHIKDVVMSKLHSAILTTDTTSNLYVCGVGRGGRLGLGDENTQFSYVPIKGPLSDKKVHSVALGQNHTLAIADNGELWTWGLNNDSQLGYSLPPPAKKDEEPMCVSPRQVFGSLKKENVVGVAASAVHSVAHTGAALYCWGRNNGQLALMDSDSRSLDIQQTPRKVAASLLSASIEMVSAIDKATTCLLSNHTVCVFTNYGYNLVKFPIPDVFANYNMTASYSNRYDPGRRDIAYVTSGGDTIAAVTARGDLFTIHVSQKDAEVAQPASSTTNPVKIKGALTQPQCIWDSRKDGVASVNVGEDGSVIICTESGAVWRRVKRLKGKSAAFTGLTDYKRKDFKFERVPYITNCVGARSSTFGAFAAIRKDNKVMARNIKVQPQTIWGDIGALLCLEDFAPIEGSGQQGGSDQAIPGVRKGSVAHKILVSQDIESELSQWLQANRHFYENTDLEIRSTEVPGISIPAHSFVLAGRSSFLREAFSELEQTGISPQDEYITLEQDGDKLVLILANADILTLLNIVVYAYQDALIPVWKHTRDSPSQAYRFRQVRSEVMKFALHLDLPELETAARTQTVLDRSMDRDFQRAIEDEEYFENSDVIIELDGEEVPAHSQLLCQRCPFFSGMFDGRSRGQWLASRKDDLDAEEKIRVDLGHISPETYYYVNAFMYGDVGPEIFDNVVADSLDEFSEIVLDVMAAANELMLDRLSQICQFILGKFVTTRNISNLLNEIGPCSVTDFKDTGLEYICLQLESMLENQLLDDLDNDLLFELDAAVRENQLARLPFARSGRAELLLYETYPDLVADIEEERTIRVKEFAYRQNQKDEDKKLSSSYKMRLRNMDEMVSPSPATEARRKSKEGYRNEPFSPSLRPKNSVADMIFDMDEDASPIVSPDSPDLKGAVDRLDLDADTIPGLPKSWRHSKGRSSGYFDSISGRASALESVSPAARVRPEGSAPAGQQGGAPWVSKALPTSKLDLKDIMSEATSTSALSAGLAEQTAKSSNSGKSQARMSQKERKKQMQMQAEAEAAQQQTKATRVPWEKVESSGRSAPWKTTPAPPKTSLKEKLASEGSAQDAIAAGAKPLVASETSVKSSRARTASPDTRFPGQGRASSSPVVPKAGSSEQKQKPLVPHSKSYITSARKTEDTVGATMADIIGQQSYERQLAQAAVAKRSLQEIQQEQAFQEWWDEESQRAQEEEARRQSKNKKDEEKVARRGRKGRGGNKSRPTQGPAAAPQPDANASSSSTQARSNSHRGRGRGRGRKT